MIERIIILPLLLAVLDYLEKSYLIFFFFLWFWEKKHGIRKHTKIFYTVESYIKNVIIRFNAL